jgi:signal transduction histidine kinase
MAADLQKAEGLRREMVADIAHELRNPLAVLRGSLEGVVDGVLPPTAENLQPLLDQTQLLARLVDDLRTLALADAGQLALNRTGVNPAEMARASVVPYLAQAEAKGVNMRAEVGVGLPDAIAVDRERLSQVLGNLVANALRHTPAGGTVTVSCEARDGGVRFAVVDTGAGIPPEALPHVFERFYRVDRGRARAEGGTGLGLAIARQLVEAHGGRIWAESALGRGTRVTFSLPA